jgi:hypothetical protein
MNYEVTNNNYPRKILHEIASVGRTTLAFAHPHIHQLTHLLSAGLHFQKARLYAKIGLINFNRII